MRPQPRTQSLDLCSHAAVTTPLFTEEVSSVDLTACGDLFVSFSEAKTDTDLTLEFESASGKEENTSCIKEPTESPESLGGRGSIERFISVSETISPADVNGSAQKQPVKGSNSAVSPNGTDSTRQDSQGQLSVRGEQGTISSAAVSEGDSGIEPCAEGEEGSTGSPGGSQTSRADVSWTPADAFSKAEDKKKGDVSF